MLKTALVTGGGSGLGRAIAKQLASKSIKVYIIGRRLSKLTKTQQFSPKNIIPVVADVSTIKGRNVIVRALKNQKIDYLVQNAAIVTPIKPLEKLTLNQWRKIQSINVEGPLFLSQALLPKMRKQSRILHISSDCAVYPLAHWIPYCTSKAALQMIYACLKKELLKKHIAVGSVDPGMMDTPMQRYICSNKTRFPEKYTRKELQDNHLLLSPEVSAAYCVRMLLEMHFEEFSDKPHVV